MSQSNPQQKQQSLVLASNNQGKLAELQLLFSQANLNFNIIPQGQLNIHDAVEDGLSFVENAIIKARHASRISGLPAIADDSGLVVPVLQGRPAIYSARFASERPEFQQNKDLANNQKLLDELRPYRDSSPIIGKFVCVLVLVRHANDPFPIIAQGVWQGEILEKLQGEQGFGYDPLFWLPSLQKTAGELSKAEKSAISHRGQAMQSLLMQLQSSW